MNNNVFRVQVGDQVDSGALAEFLRRVYRPNKSQFVIEHGRWLYRGVENQWVVVNSAEKIVAYCAVIPTRCSINGEPVEALWWVDLIVDPAYRGQGIQSIIDTRLRQRSALKLGIPNALAAKIHRKHGWGVRENGATLMLPLRPLGVKQVQLATGFRGVALTVGAAMLSPLAAMWRLRLRPTPHHTAKRVYHAQAQDLAAIFEQHKAQMPVTTYRDRLYIQWRYLDAPYAQALRIYTAGPNKMSTCCLIARYVTFKNVKAVRIIDLFGDLTDLPSVRDLVRQAAYEAGLWGATQITIFNFLPELKQLLRRLGFIVSVPGRFCWHSQDTRLMQQFETQLHWTIGDSDNDEPE